MKTIEILIGIPCSGKSIYASKECNFNTVIISRDNIRECHFEQPYKFSKENEDKISEIFNVKVINNFWRKEITKIILDNTHCKEKYIDEIIRKYPNCYIKIKYFEISLFKAHIRNIIRYFKTDKWIPLKIMNQMHKNYKQIDKTKYEKYR